jgi:hypothetical protein
MLGKFGKVLVPMYLFDSKYATKLSFYFAESSDNFKVDVTNAGESNECSPKREGYFENILPFFLLYDIETGLSFIESS